MIDPSVIFILLLIISTIVSAGLAQFAWTRRHLASWIAPFILLMGAAAIWSLGYAFEIFSPDLNSKILWTKLEYTGIIIVPIAWLTFAIRYTLRTSVVHDRRLYALGLIPLISFALVWTNGQHQLIWTNTSIETINNIPLLQNDYGSWFWVHSAYSYILIISGSLLFLYGLRQLPSSQQGQLIFLLIAPLLPLITNLAYLFLPGFKGVFDPTPIGFTITGIIIALGIIQTQLLDLAPIARQLTINNMRDGMLVINLENRIVDINPTAAQILGQPSNKLLGQSARQVFADYPDFHDELYGDLIRTDTKITFGAGDEHRDYDLQISPLLDHQGRSYGRLIVMRDITANKEVIDLLAERVAELAESRRALERSENRLRALVSGAPVILFTTDRYGTITLAEGQDIERLGLQRGENIERSTLALHDQSALENINYALDGESFTVNTTIPPYTFEMRYAPLLKEDTVLGVICVAVDISQRKQVQTKLLYQKQLFENLVTVARTTSQGVRLEKVLQNVVDVSAMFTQAERSSLMLVDEDTRLVRHMYLSLGEDKVTSLPPHVNRVMDTGVAGWIARNREPVLIPDTVKDDRWANFSQEHYQTRSVLAVPLLRGGRLQGVLTLQHSQTHHFTPEHQQFIKAAADQMALAIHNAQIHEAQRRLAEQQSMVYQILRAISPLHDPNEVMNLAVQILADNTNWPAIALLWRNSEKNDDLDVKAATGPLNDRIGKLIHADEGLIGEVITTGQTNVIIDLSDSEHRAHHDSHLHSLLITPLRQGDNIHGVLYIGHKDIGAFNQDDIQLIEVISETITLGIDNANTQQELYLSATENRRLYQSIVNEHARLLALIQASRDGILLINLEQNISVINETALDFLQLDGTLTDWTGRPFKELLAQFDAHNPAVQAAYSEIKRVVDDHDTDSNYGEFELPPRIIHWSNLPVTGEDNNSLGRLLVLHDITDERLLNRMRDDLTHTMVHDLRNPIGSVGTSLQILRYMIGNNIPDKGKDLLQIAQRSNSKSLNLVNAILDISRLERGHMPIDYAQIDLHRLITNEIAAQEPVAEGKNISLTTDITLQPALVWADQGLIERVLQNLIGNAIKFTPQNGTITIKVTPNDSQPDQLLIHITDTGSGIPPEISERLFQKFTTGTQDERGSGLGLAFCKMAIEAHEQNLWVADTSPQGTTFAFTLSTTAPSSIKD
ncbi:MAG TPA: histidine kinase N-terminal 7TM domain-containing protein [Anaerolineae bacterium]|nr:histidine kinase N-terminal 7TM domain-containing protein [Anaerolineae bacterium]